MGARDDSGNAMAAHCGAQRAAAKTLVEAVKDKDISLCGIKSDQTTADFRKRNLKPADAILLASDLSKAGVTGSSITSLDLALNRLCGVWDDFDGQGLKGTFTAEGILALSDALKGNASLTVTNVLRNGLDAESAKMLAEVAKQKGISLCGIQRDQTTANFSGDDLKLANAILLASDLSQAVVSTSLTEIDLHQNGLKDEGVIAICEAVQSNKETKLASLTVSQNDIRPAGAASVAAMVAVVGSVTSIDVSHNSFDQAASLELIAAMKGKSMVSIGMVKCNLRVEGAKSLADLVMVTPSLTNILVGENNWGDECTTILCDALRESKVTNVQELDLSFNRIGPEGAKAVAAMAAVVGSSLTALDVQYNRMGSKGFKALLQNAVSERAGFDLKV